MAARVAFLTVPTVNHPTADVARAQALLALPVAQRKIVLAGMDPATRSKTRIIIQDLIIDAPRFNAGRKASAEKRMARVDGFSPPLREQVNKHGLAPVQTCLDFGITKAARIDHLLSTLAHRTTDGKPADFGNMRAKPVEW